MKKIKTYEISIIDKTYSKTISDETKFYTSDTALEIGFELKETDYNFESAEIVLLNVDDRSLVTRPVAKSLDSFTYKLEDDIIAHYGEWRGQVRFEQAGEVYVSSPVKFRIENDLSKGCPPQLSDVQSWVSLKRYADGLVDELKQAVLSVEGVEDTFNENENIRQTTFETNEQSRQDAFETNEIERDETFNTNETTRQSQELEREKAEAERQTVFDDNEVNRTETFNANEATRQEKETTRQQAESQRQSTFEANESERQTTFETAEQERQSAEVIRVDNENQRNLTSVEEFIKLQDSIGGRNYLLNSDKPSAITFSSNNSSIMPLTRGVENGVDYLQQPFEGKLNISTYISEMYANHVGIKYSEDLSKHTGTITISIDIMANVPLKVRFLGYTTIQETIANNWTRVSQVTLPQHLRPAGLTVASSDNPDVPADTKVYWRNIKIEKGAHATPYTKAPEDYTSVTKDDYYNHIELVNYAKNNQFNQLKQAVISLGGII